MPRLSELPAASSLDTDDEFYVVQGGNSRKATLEDAAKAAASASGSAPIFACRAWVQFNGTTSPGTIAASGNVASVTRAGTGDYTINFTTEMPDANFAVSVSAGSSGGGSLGLPSGLATGSVRVLLFDLAGAPRDDTFVSVAVFR